MVIVDTSVWIDVLRDGTGGRRATFASVVGGREVWLTRFTQLELLQGAADEREWSLLHRYLEGQEYVETGDHTWVSAARVYFELRRAGITVRSPLDCCIAALAMEAEMELLHRDRDFSHIGAATSLRERFVAWTR